MSKISLGGIRMSRGYQARLKIHIIRVVFQDQALYARTSFRGAKTCKIGKKGAFLVITNFGKDMTDKLRKMHAKTHIEGLFSYLKNMWLGCFLCDHGQAWYPLLPFEYPPRKISKLSSLHLQSWVIVNVVTRQGHNNHYLPLLYSTFAQYSGYSYTENFSSNKMPWQILAPPALGNLL